MLILLNKPFKVLRQFRDVDGRPSYKPAIRIAISIACS